MTNLTCKPSQAGPAESADPGQSREDFPLNALVRIIDFRANPVPGAVLMAQFTLEVVGVLTISNVNLSRGDFGQWRIFVPAPRGRGKATATLLTSPMRRHLTREAVRLFNQQTKVAR